MAGRSAGTHRRRTRRAGAQRRTADGRSLGSRCKSATALAEESARPPLRLSRSRAQDRSWPDPASRETARDEAGSHPDVSWRDFCGASKGAGSPSAQKQARGSALAYRRLRRSRRLTAGIAVARLAWGQRVGSSGVERISKRRQRERERDRREKSQAGSGRQRIVRFFGRGVATASGQPSYSLAQTDGECRGGRRTSEYVNGQANALAGCLALRRGGEQARMPAASGPTCRCRTSMHRRPARGLAEQVEGSISDRTGRIRSARLRTGHRTRRWAGRHIDPHR